MGVKKKVWLYIYRVQQHVTDKMLLNYLNNKNVAKNPDFEVKELPAGRNKNKCFCVGASFDLKAELYNSSFWPAGIGFKRFDFQRYNSYNNPFL